MKAISFSLWCGPTTYYKGGTVDNSIYLCGAIRNAELQKIYFPDYTCVFWVDDTVPQSYIDKLIELDCIVRYKPQSSNWQGLLWRIDIAFEDVDVFIIRDCDSRLSEREAHAIYEFEDSNYSFHRIIDHQNHQHVPIMGGLWGGKKGVITPDMFKINTTTQNLMFCQDQSFLEEYIWPHVQNNTLTHSSVSHGPDIIELPPVVDNVSFMGNKYDCNDRPYYKYDQR